MNDEEEEVLRAEITVRRAARRSAQRKKDNDESKECHQREQRHLSRFGTRVSEGHRNYVLMYDMLTGIRIAVGRISAKLKRDLLHEDFAAAHKLVFDITGNELTPGVKYDFKFKDYAPWVFRNIREKFHIDAGDYLMSLTSQYILSELGSPGKSGSFFYYSRDYRFIIKTIHVAEHKFMRKILNYYYQHVCENPNTLLCRFYGLHRIKLPRGRKIHFVVMENIFPSNLDVHETFDLKGSMFGRLTSDEEVARNPHAVMKDQNWVENQHTLKLGPTKRAIFLEQLERDVTLLKKLNIMDYSLLVGVHDLRRGNSEGIRDHHLQIVKPLDLHKTSTSATKADIVRKALKHANPVQIDTSELPESPSKDRGHCVFYSDNGGYRSSDENDNISDALYFIGVIDILTPYNLVKKTEHLWKSITQNKNTISSVPPTVYGNRFSEFIHKATCEPNNTYIPSQQVTAQF
ncbi:hypothetical protein BDF14DRAFT_1951240 [Spinellus fusiger]|nr:hypothetical protein BDF14DRAFT_1951240 [Spinellus fusiger]